VLAAADWKPQVVAQSGPGARLFVVRGLRNPSVVPHAAQQFHADAEIDRRRRRQAAGGAGRGERLGRVSRLRRGRRAAAVGRSGPLAAGPGR